MLPTHFPMQIWTIFLILAILWTVTILMHENLLYTQSRLISLSRIKGMEAEVDCESIVKLKPPKAILGYRTALASFPRSGNTFLRTLVELSTGLETSSLYCDRTLKHYFHSECDKSASFLVKTHFPLGRLRKHLPDLNNHWRGFDRFIQLVRNPIDSIVSYHHYRRSGYNHIRKIGTFKNFQMNHDRLSWLIQRYKWHFHYWKNAPRPNIMVKYEDLRGPGAISEAERVLSFLVPPDFTNDLPAKNIEDSSHWARSGIRNRVSCSIDKMRNKLPYHSNTSHNPFLYGIEWLDTEQLRMIFDELGQIMCQLGYDEKFFELADKMYINTYALPVTHGPVMKALEDASISFNCSNYETIIHEGLINKTISLMTET